jgi:Tfp pilus assembly protein PilN
MDGTHFDVSGYTLEPSALSEWRTKLAQSPLMQDMELAAIRVENVRTTAGRERWSFQLRNTVVHPPVPKEQKP